MSVDPIDYTVEDSVATIVFNVPMLNRSSMPALLAALEQANADPGVGAIVLTGRHHVFLSGADLKEVATLKSRSDVMDFLAVPIRIVRLLRSTKCMSFAAINGFCLGGGFEIAIACDFRYCAESLPAHIPQPAFIGLPEITLGLVPGAGGAFLAGRSIGLGRVSELMLTGRPLGPQEANRVGLVHGCYPRKDLLATVQNLARATLRESLTDIQTVRGLIHGNKFTADLEAAQTSEAEAFADCVFSKAAQSKLAELGAASKQRAMSSALAAV